MGDQTKQILKKANRPIFHAYLATARRKGGKAKAIIDGDGRKFTYEDITRASFALAGPIGRKTEKKEALGILLPTGIGVVLSMFAMHVSGRTPTMLNFTAGAANIKAACAVAKVTKVVTAHAFIEKAGLESLIDELKESVEFLYLEELREEIKKSDKVRAVLGPILPSLFAARPNPQDTAVILFTSGTEGSPKGVALSHTNVIANIEQIYAHVEMMPGDIFFNPLPAFHCYGLTAGTLWPLITGYPSVLHPSPLQTKIIAKRIFETGSTVLFATDTFLQQYMRASPDGGMSSLRIAVCGAERVREETRQMAERRFSFEVLEGYGVTECTPVLAANQPGDIRAGTIGKLLPAVEARLEPVEGLSDAGRLVVRGPNVMKGYLLAETPGEIQPPPDGWHDTGDVVSISDEGYLTVRGRLKRFAKIGGEMVSLTVVENCASAVWPNHTHAAAILPDKRKGEQIVLVTDNKDATRDQLLTWSQTHGVAEIAIPKKIVHVDEVPVLGSGKLNYGQITALAKAQLAPSEAPASTPLEDPTMAEGPQEEETTKEETSASSEYTAPLSDDTPIPPPNDDEAIGETNGQEAGPPPNEHSDQPQTNPRIEDGAQATSPSKGVNQQDDIKKAAE